MKILERHILKNFFWPFLFCSLIFISMFIIVDSLNHVDDFIKNETPLNIILYYYAVMIPVILSHVVPSSVMIAALYSLSTLNKNHEIVAMKANGVSGYRILLPLLYFSLIISFSLLMINETVAPKSSIISSSIKTGLIKNKGEDIRQRTIENVAILTSSNRMIYARELMPGTKSLYDVIILEHRSDLSLKSKITAKRGLFTNPYWTFYDVMEYQVDHDGNMKQKPQKHEAKEYSIIETPDEFLKQYTKPEFMSYRQLKQYLDTTKITGFKASQRLEIDLYNKISSPFICFIMLLVCAPLALNMRRGGAMVSIGMGLFVIVVYYSIIALSTALGKGGTLQPIVAAWAPNLIFFFVGSYMLKKRI